MVPPGVEMRSNSVTHSVIRPYICTGLCSRPARTGIQTFGHKTFGHKVAGTTCWSQHEIVIVTIKHTWCWSQNPPNDDCPLRSSDQ